MPVSGDTTAISTVPVSNDSINKPVLESTITYSATDSIIPDFENQKVYMYKGGVVNYQSIELKADYIVLDLANKEVYAEGLPDSTGTKVGTPVFKDGKEEFESKTLRYNFETQKGIITDVKTKEGDGFVHSELTKKISPNEFVLRKGKYTTCD
ncbi:MAG TPA: LPS-assembly protein LptD, partial [Prolixibacteraceae bacterium]|nr:LPS-assembly protein LptD [Prolixibacteraceae bacterium]